MENQTKSKTLLRGLGGNNGPEGIGINYYEIEHVNNEGESLRIGFEGGSLFTDSKQTGIDTVILDLREEFQNLDSIVLTHGHLDHLGSIAHTVAIGGECPKIYCSYYTAAVLNNQFQNLGIGYERRPEIEYIGPTPEKEYSVTQIGDIEITAFGLTHSIYGALAIGVKTPDIKLFTTGDGRLNPMGGKDYTVGYETNLDLISDYCKDVDVFMADSTSVMSDKTPPTEHEIQKDLVHKFKQNADKKILVSTISNNIPRLISVISAAAIAGFKVRLDGKGVQQSWLNALITGKKDPRFDPLRSVREAVFAETGRWMKIDVTNANDAEEKNDGHRYVTICTGSNAESYSVFERVSTTGIYRNDEINEGYAFIRTQRTIPIPQNIVKVKQMIKNIESTGAKFIDALHASGHFSRKEMETFLDAAVNKEHNTLVIPSHGNKEHRESMAQLCRDMKIPVQHFERGDIIELSKDELPKIVGHHEFKTLGVVDDKSRDKTEISIKYYDININKLGEVSYNEEDEPVFHYEQTQVTRGEKRKISKQEAKLKKQVAEEMAKIARKIAKENRKEAKNERRQTRKERKAAKFAEQKIDKTILKPEKASEIHGFSNFPVDYAIVSAIEELSDEAKGIVLKEETYTPAKPKAITYGDLLKVAQEDKLNKIKQNIKE